MLIRGIAHADAESTQEQRKESLLDDRTLAPHGWVFAAPTRRCVADTAIDFCACACAR